MSKIKEMRAMSNLTFNLQAYYAPMLLWIHREPDVVTKFVTIMTDYGKMLALTPRHLIFRNKCDGKRVLDLFRVLTLTMQKGRKYSSRNARSRIL